jgi:lysophospholipase
MLQPERLIREVHLVELPVVHQEWWSNNVKYTEFRRQGVQIMCASFIQPSISPRANITVLTGWSECFLKYADIIKTLYELGFNVHTYDHQSQGLSGRWLAESQSTYIENFDDYVEDLLFFQTYIVNKGASADLEKRTPAFLLAHSMGGLVGLLAMARQPSLFSRAAMTAPMIRNKCGMKSLDYKYPLPQELVYWMCRLMRLLTLGSAHALGYDIERAENPLKLGITTNDIDHLHDWQLLRRRYPHIMSTCVTNDWTLAAIRGQKAFHQMFRRVRTNTLIISASDDRFVHNRAMRTFVKDAPNARLLHAPDACHELLFERPAVRSATIKACIDLFSQPSHSVHLVRASPPLETQNVNAPTFTRAEQALRLLGLVVAIGGIGYGINLIVIKRDR